MLSLSHLLCDHEAGNEKLRYGRPAADPTPRPVVAWHLTKACNLRCVHCYAGAKPDADLGELTTDEGFALLDDLASFNIPALLLSGGEPLVRPDFFQLLDHARAAGLRCTLSTNGLLIDDRVADRLAASGLCYAGISLDGDAGTHDRLRGQRGAFDGALAAVRRCRDRGLRVGVRFTVHGLNHQHLDRIIDLCVAEGVDRLCVYHLAYAGRGEGMQRVDLSASQTRAVLDRLIERTVSLHAQRQPLEVLTVSNHADNAYLLLHLEAHAPDRAAAVRQRLQRNGGNRSGSHIASISPRGDVHVDQFSWHHTCGNVRQQRFSTLWRDAADERLAILRDRQPHLPARCRRCRFLNVCNGNLRARAEAATGNWLGMDPGCYLSDDEIFAPEPDASRLAPVHG